MTVHYVDAGVDPTPFLRWYRGLGTRAYVACDVETSGLDPWGDRLRLVQFGGVETAYVLPFPQQRGPIAEALDYGRPLVGHNGLVFDAQFLTNNGFDSSGLVDDTKVASCLLGHRPEKKETALKHLADQYIGPGSSASQKALRDVMKKNKWTWGTVPQDCYEYWYYGGQDTILTARLAADHLMPAVRDRGYLDLYDMEIDVLFALQRAAQRGVCVDLEYAQEQFDVLMGKANEIQSYHDIKLGGRKDLAVLLEATGSTLPRTRPTERFPQGQPKLDEDVLLQIDHPIVDDVLRYRDLKKQANTYFKAVLDLEVDGRIHTTINTVGARTGRMSSERPNMQNWPKREAGDYVRRMVIPSPGNVFVLADYAQIEYRIFASMCGEPAMVQAFLDGKDMHAVTAELALGHAPSEKERLIAKNGNFSELYGAGIEKYAKTAEISIEAATRFKRQYHQMFPRVKPFTRAAMRYAQSRGYSVETTFGRFIAVDPERTYAATNYMIQGSAADILKRAIQRIAKTPWDEFFVLPIHDELIFDVPQELAPQLMRELPELMEDHDTFSVPLTVDVTRASRWGVKEEAA